MFGNYYNSNNRELQYVFIFSTFYVKIVTIRTVINHDEVEEFAGIA